MSQNILYFDVSMSIKDTSETVLSISENNKIIYISDEWNKRKVVFGEV